MDIRDYMRQSIDIDKRELKHYRKLAKAKYYGTLKSRIKNGKYLEYYIVTPEHPNGKYAGAKQRKTIEGIKLKRFAQRNAKRYEIC